MKKTEIVKTKFGKIQGYQEASLKIFKGIPYAAPPIGNLRFRPPIDNQSWQDVINTTEFGSYAPQGFTFLEEMFGKYDNQNEDNCLTLNIWTPGLDNNKRPVMVYIHGGSFVFGGGADIWYGVDGSELARHGNVVVITINYRLGTFGFLYIPDETANVGLLDQVAALKWINENIESFGGDPDNITIFGESAGGLSVLTLITMPDTKDLFHKAIVQSSPILDTKSTVRSTTSLMKELNIKQGDIDALREIPANRIIAAQNSIIERWFNEGIREIMDFRPSIDGKIIPLHPIDALKKGQGKDIDILIGSNKDEVKLWTITYPRIQNLKMKELPNILTTQLKKFGKGELCDNKKFCEILIDTYKTSLRHNPIDIYDSIDTDFTFRIPSIRICEAHSLHNPNTYNYLFTWPSPALEGKYGSCHVVEIPFAFGTIGKTGGEWFYGSGKEAELLSDKMMKTWIAFAHKGNPNHESIPEWKGYDVENRSTMFIGKEFKLVDAPYDKERSVWDQVYF